MAKNLKVRKNYSNFFLLWTSFFLVKIWLLQYFVATTYSNVKDYGGHIWLSPPAPNLYVKNYAGFNSQKWYLTTINIVRIQVLVLLPMLSLKLLGCDSCFTSSILTSMCYVGLLQQHQRALHIF